MRKNNSLNIWILNLNFWSSHLIRYGVVMYDWKMPLLNKNVNYAFGKCWSKSLILQYGTLNGPKRVFQQKMVLFSSQTSYSRGSMSTNITQVRDKFSWQVNLWFIVPKWHDIELTWALSHLPQRTNFPAMSYTYGVFIF